MSSNDISGAVKGKVETAGDQSVLDKLGDKLFGPTAESTTSVADDSVAPDAAITPVTQGRRSHRPDGQDPFHNSR
ncbi:hypothetical protein PT974_04891 [Cladobotryum mycophilum]|uniref:Uncharacterized protein n=1 Tax=Cladobotryum mycophilum TaxID=491253 RepID=A0ABR0SQH0_9HYPO